MTAPTKPQGHTGEIRATGVDGSWRRLYAAGGVLGIGRTKVYELLRAGVIESVRVGSSRRIPVGALDEYVARLRATSSGYEVA
jgi:excisionase family DNA binding protein